MLIKSILITILLSSIGFAKESCTKGSIRYIHNKKIKKENIVFCIDQDKRDKFIYSKNCKGLMCDQVKEPWRKGIDLGKYPSSVGSPGFKVCRELGGSPQIIEFQINDGEWNQSSRCMFNNKTFVSNNLLIKLWKPYILD